MTLKDFAFMDEDIPAAEKLERFVEINERMGPGGLWATSKELEELIKKVEKACEEEPELGVAAFKRIDTSWSIAKKRTAAFVGEDRTVFCIEGGNDDISPL